MGLLVAPVGTLRVHKRRHRDGPTPQGQSHTQSGCQGTSSAARPNGEGPGAWCAEPSADELRVLLVRLPGLPGRRFSLGIGVVGLGRAAMVRCLSVAEFCSAVLPQRRGGRRHLLRVQSFSFSRMRDWDLPIHCRPRPPARLALPGHGQESLLAHPRPRGRMSEEPPHALRRAGGRGRRPLGPAVSQEKRPDALAFSLLWTQDASYCRGLEASVPTSIRIARWRSARHASARTFSSCLRCLLQSS